MLIGGFFDAHGAGWGDADMALFEALLEEQDVDIMAWAMGTQAPPARFEGAILAALRVLNYVPVAK